MPESDNILENLVEQVQKGDKYRQISPGLVRILGAKELAKRKNLKEAVKATRNKLHQVGSAYQEKPIPYANWEEELLHLPSDLADPAVRDFILKALPAHASTRERIPILPRFFEEALADIKPIHSVLDLACGLNPLAIPWMPLAEGFRYTACDIYTDMTAFLNSFFQKFNIIGEAVICDLTQEIPASEADIAFVLKTIPCLEQVDDEAGSRILSQLKTPNILVSFPARSLGGKSKGMLQNYERHFNQLVAGYSWKITRFEFPGELAFLIQK